MIKDVRFTKMVGAGNDFIVTDNRSGVIGNDAAKIAKKLSNRKHSIGADGLILLEKSSAIGGSASGGKKADFRMRIFNPDGSEAEMCGNGVRCVAKFAVDHKIKKGLLSIETLAGIIEAEVRGHIVKAKLVKPKGLKLNFSLQINGRSEILNFIDTGVPHAVKLLDSLEGVDVDQWGSQIRRHPYFAPRGTNADLISLGSQNKVEVRTYERGVEGETLSCGTGSTAAALVAAALKGLKSPVFVRTKGGETLKVYFSKKGSEFFNVYLEGPVQTTFEGRVVL